MHLFFLTADEHFAPWGHFTPQRFLLLNTFCSLEHFAPQHILPSGTLLLGTLCSLDSLGFIGAKCSLK